MDDRDFADMEKEAVDRLFEGGRVCPVCYESDIKLPIYAGDIPECRCCGYQFY